VISGPLQEPAPVGTVGSASVDTAVVAVAADFDFQAVVPHSLEELQKTYCYQGILPRDWAGSLALELVEEALLVRVMHLLLYLRDLEVELH
jgi:hypothetical protein